MDAVQNRDRWGIDLSALCVALALLASFLFIIYEIENEE